MTIDDAMSAMLEVSGKQFKKNVELYGAIHTDELRYSVLILTSKTSFVGLHRDVACRLLGNMLFNSTCQVLHSPECFCQMPTPAFKTTESVGSQHESSAVICSGTGAKQWPEKEFLNPLKDPLPDAPNMRIYCMYGVGAPAERSYHYQHVDDTMVLLGALPISMYALVPPPCSAFQTSQSLTPCSVSCRASAATQACKPSLFVLSAEADCS